MDTKKDEDRFPTASETAQNVAALRKRLMRDRTRIWKVGQRKKCPVCHKRTLEGRDDLVRQRQAGPVVWVMQNLHGARCNSCSVEFLEAYDELALEDIALDQFRASFHAKVSKVSGRNLGTYWPKEIIRNMQLHEQDSLDIYLLNEDTMVLERHHGHAPPKA